MCVGFFEQAFEGAEPWRDLSTLESEQIDAELLPLRRGPFAVTSSFLHSTASGQFGQKSFQTTGRRRERKLIGWRCRSTTLP